jgi:N4-gp56 family major capsid protein
MLSKYLAAADSALQAKAAPQFDGYYLGFFHTNVVYDLRTENNTGSFIDVNKYKRPEEILKGEVGTLGGIRVISCPYIQTYVNTEATPIVIYPSYFIGTGAY